MSGEQPFELRIISSSEAHDVIIAREQSFQVAAIDQEGKLQLFQTHVLNVTTRTGPGATTTTGPPEAQGNLQEESRPSPKGTTDAHPDNCKGTCCTGQFG